jgi:hypothetical protein
MSVKLEVSSDGKKLLNAIKQLHNKSVKIGWLDGLHYEVQDAHGGISEGEAVAAVAAQNEYGNPSKNIPARPFIRPTVIREKNKWINITQKGVQEILKGNQSIDGVLNLLGAEAVVDMQDSISAVFSPALKEQTILARIERSKKLSRIKGQISYKNLGNVTKPLEDTGVMINDISHELSDE